MYDLDKRHEARVLRAKQLLEQLQKDGVTQEDREAIDEHLDALQADSESVPVPSLTPHQDRILDDVLMPMKAEAEEAFRNLALARAGDTAQAQKMADALSKEFPQDTLVNSYWLPLARASMELNRRTPNKSVELLSGIQGYDVGQPVPVIAPVVALYLRGYAYLEAGKNKESAAEFQGIVDRPGIVVNSPIGSLAHLSLGRALVAAGEKEKARTAYQDFLSLRKDADPDIPILKQAKAEYAKLQ